MEIQNLAYSWKTGEHFVGQKCFFKPEALKSNLLTSYNENRIIALSSCLYGFGEEMLWGLCWVDSFSSELVSNPPDIPPHPCLEPELCYLNTEDRSKNSNSPPQ